MKKLRANQWIDLSNQNLETIFQKKLQSFVNRYFHYKEEDL